MIAIASITWRAPALNLMRSLIHNWAIAPMTMRVEKVSQAINLIPKKENELRSPLNLHPRI